MSSQPNARIFLVATLAATLLCTIAGPFGTGALPVPTRMLVWAALITFNALKWWVWYRWLGPRIPAGPWAAFTLAAGGAVVLNATLPLEIAWVYRAVGIDFTPDWLGMWLIAGLISVSISAVVTAAAWHRPPPQALPAPEAAPPGPARGLARKTDMARLLAVTSEDHYLRLHMEGGDKPLLLYRFGDALADLQAIDGLQVHRGAWVAARAVTAAERDGRRWWLRLPDGTRLPVSDRHLPAVRARGWLAR
ncbi:MAG: LytTR family DNA-binding domain-containing protein [Sandaracinobacter sp.]